MYDSKIKENESKYETNFYLQKENFKSEISVLTADHQNKISTLKMDHETEKKIQVEFFEKTIKEKDFQIDTITHKIESLNKTINDKDQIIFDLNAELKATLDKIKSFEYELHETKQKMELTKENYGRLQVKLERDYQEKNVK